MHWGRRQLFYAELSGKPSWMRLRVEQRPEGSEPAFLWGRGGEQCPQKEHSQGTAQEQPTSPGAQRGWGRASERQKRRAKIRKVMGQVILV